MNITWYRFRHKWSSGYSSWEESHEHGEYTIEDLEDLISSEHDNNWSEHYRGFDFEILKHPSDEYVGNLKQRTINAITYNTQLLEFLNTIQQGGSDAII